jgi:hypothetical protein
MITVNYPGKKRLTEAEAAEVLRTGSPRPEWFEPWAEHAVWMGRETKHGFGYVHVYSIAGSFQYDFAAYPTKEGLGSGLEALWRLHNGKLGPTDDPSYPKCEGCQGVAYFMPDEPPHLYMVVEYDEDDEDES